MELEFNQTKVLIDLENLESNIRLKLEVVGYQFPEPTGNWLNIKLMLIQNSKLFEKVDAALDTKDLTHIYAWFEALSKNDLPRYANLTFIEPCLGFSFLGKTGDVVRISVDLDYEFKPKFRLKQFTMQSNRWHVVFDLSELDFENILKNIRTAIHSYPMKN